MKTLEAAHNAAMTARALARSAVEIPPSATKARIESNFRIVQRLLSEERGISNSLGILEQLKQPVASWLRTGVYAELEEPRNLRRISYFLDDQALAKPSLLESGRARMLVLLMDEKWRDSYLTPLIMLMLRHYFDEGKAKESVDAIMAIVKRRLGGYKGSRTIPSMARLFSEAIFTKKDPVQVATQVKDIGMDWFQACESSHIVPQVQGTAFFGIALVEYAAKIANPEALLDAVVLDKIKKLGDADISKAVMAVLIDRCGSSAEYVSTLISNAFTIIGDPILEANWRCSGTAFKRYSQKLETARMTVSTWINHQVLEYFFSKADMDGKRKAFWSKYAPKMSMIRIAMHTGWSFSFKFSGNKEIDTWIRNRLVRVEVETTDIGLIMEYRDWGIVEIGAYGNSCYIYNRNNPVIKDLRGNIRTMASLKRPHMQTLRDFNYEGEGRIIHSDGWEYTIKNILRNKMGLTP